MSSVNARQSRFSSDIRPRQASARNKDSAWHEWAVEELAQVVGGGAAQVNPVVLAEVSVRAADEAAIRFELES